MRVLGVLTALTLVAGALGGCSASSVPTGTATPSATATPRTSSPTPSATASPTATATATFRAVVDGDTLDTDAGLIRIIGIDTPERGECGDTEAAATFNGVLSAGDLVTLELPPGQNDRDQYDRLIRYVTTTTGVDLGLLQLTSGHAIAKYDSTDGYPAHPREAEYHAAQLASADPDGTVITTACRDRASAVAPPVAPVAPPAAAPAPQDQWWTQYSSCSKLKKNAVGHPIGPFSRDDPAQAAIYDWFENGTGNHGDGDNDGLACE